MTIGLYTNLSGQPGTLLENWTATFPDELDVPLITLTSVLNPFIAAGTQYWAVVSVDPSGVTWGYNTQGVIGGEWIGFSFADWTNYGITDFPTPAIELDAVSNVPEPISAISLGLGFLAMIALHKRWSRPSGGCV